MDRRTLAGGIGALALVVVAVVLLREPGLNSLKREIDGKVEVVAQQEPQVPTNARTQALDADALQIAWAGSAAAYQVTWNGQQQLVPTSEVEIAGLQPDEPVEVEIRAVNAVGRRSDPLKVSATPKTLYNDKWDDQLVGQIDRFDGPESLAPSRWQMIADPTCLGLRPFGNGKRVDIDCQSASFQSNTPIRFGVPAPDGAVGRAVLSVGGTVESSRVRLSLRPDKWRFLTVYDDASSRSGLSLDITTQGTRIIADPDLPRTDVQIPLGDTPVTGLVAGVRHRWELRVLPDAVVALRDGVVVASEPVRVTESLMWPQLQVDGGGFLDAFGVGGVPERVVPTEVIAIPENGELPAHELQDAAAAKIIMEAPGLLFVDGRPVRTAALNEFQSIADIPVTSKKIAPGLATKLVVIRKPASGPGVLPRLQDRPSVKPGLPKLTVMHENGARPAEQLPYSGRILVTAEINSIGHRGIEIELDGKRIVALPTDEQGAGVPGRHEFWLNTRDFPPGGHARLKLRVLPADHGEPVTTETVFELRKTP